MTPPSAQSLEVQISTSEHKIIPLKKAVRELLGYPHPRRVPRGVYAEQAIGISTDEFTRAKDSGLRFPRNVFPLIELGLDRAMCVEFLADRGFGATVKSAYVGCPFHGNTGWADRLRGRFADLENQRRSKQAELDDLRINAEREQSQQPELLPPFAVVPPEAPDPLQRALYGACGPQDPLRPQLQARHHPRHTSRRHPPTIERATTVIALNNTNTDQPDVAPQTAHETERRCPCFACPTGAPCPTRKDVIIDDLDGSNP